MYVILISFPCVDAGSTTLPSGGDAKDATPKKQCGNTEEGFNGKQHALECIIYVKCYKHIHPLFM